jgi:hypothetical protein
MLTGTFIKDQKEENEKNEVDCTRNQNKDQSQKMERTSTCPKSLLTKVGLNPMSLLEDFIPTMLQQPQLQKVSQKK